MIYSVEYLPSALKKLSKLPLDVQRRLVRVIDSLAHDRFPAGAEKMTNAGGAYKVRVGGYRIIYEIHHDRLIVTVLSVGDRKEVYR